MRTKIKLVVGTDQTRGWFYTLLVLSTALFNKPPFKNLIVNGLVLAADGQKMSKKKKNYPDPLLVVNKYGADAVRLYIINSPVVKAESLRFKEDGVKDVLKVRSRCRQAIQTKPTSAASCLMYFLNTID